MLVSTEKRLGLIAASALTAASMLLMSQQHPLMTYKVTEISQPAQLVLTPMNAAMTERLHTNNDYSVQQHIAMR
ncbi:hypothetical protein ACLBWZ_01740 [Brucellaceae bacterium C25G]